MNKIYNEVRKKMFLEQFDKSETKEVYSRVFLKSYELEKELEKDLYDFDIKVLEKFIKDYLKPSTKESARTYCNVVSSYITWGIENRYSHLYVNPMKKSPEYFYDFVQDKRLYFSYDEKEAILDGLINDQDKFIIQALFEGIEGSKVSELVSIKKSDLVKKEAVTEVDYYDFYVNVSRKDKIVQLPIEAKTYYIGIGANAQREYYKKNGEVDYSHNVKDSVPLLDSDYVLKMAKTRKENEGKKVSHYTVYNRLETIKNLEDFEEYSDALSTKNIVRSGMIYWAKLIMDREGIDTLERVHYEEICERFGIKYKWALRDFINVDVINELYG